MEQLRSKYSRRVEKSDKKVFSRWNFANQQRKKRPCPVQAAGRRRGSQYGAFLIEIKNPNPSHLEQVRISLFWWTIWDSITDFAPWGKIVWMQPVSELAAARCHWHPAFRWVQVLYRPLKRENTTRQVVFLMVDDIGLEPMTFRTSSGCSSQLS